MNTTSTGGSSIEITPSFGPILRAWIESNFPSIREFSRRSDIPYQTLNNYLQGKRDPNFDAIKKLAKMGFPINNRMLVDGDDGFDAEPVQVNEATNDSFSELFEMVPEVDVSASAGLGSCVFSEDEVDGYAFKKSYLRSRGIGNSKLSVIHVSGDSMEPILCDEELVLINHDASPVSGKIHVFLSGGDLYIKKLTLTKRGWLGISLNSVYDPIEIDDEDQIIGQAVCAMKNL